MPESSSIQVISGDIRRSFRKAMVCVAAAAMDKVPQIFSTDSSDVFAFDRFIPELFTPCLNRRSTFTQYLGPEPTMKIAAPHHQPPLRVSEISLVLIPKLSLQAHPLHPRAFLYSVDPCDFHPAPKDCSSQILQKRRNANRPALQRRELLYHPWQLQRHEQSQDHQTFREA